MELERQSGGETTIERQRKVVIRLVGVVFGNYCLMPVRGRIETTYPVRGHSSLSFAAAYN